MRVDSDEYRKKLGKYIKDNRKARKLSREALVWDEARGAAICSTKYLSAIEAGSRKASRQIIQDLLERMGLDLERWDKEAEREMRVRFDNEFEEIMGLLVKEDYQGAKAHYEALVQAGYYEKELPYYRQHVVFLTYHLPEEQGQLTMAQIRELLKMSQPRLFKAEEIDLGYLAGTEFEMIEYRLLNVLGVELWNDGKTKEGIVVFKAMIKSLLRKLVEIEVRRVLLPLMHYNLSKAWIGEGAYEETIKTCQTGMVYALEKGMSPYFPLLKYNEGVALWHLQRLDEARQLLIEARGLFRILKDEKSAQFVEQMAIEKYVLTLD